MQRKKVSFYGGELYLNAIRQQMLKDCPKRKEILLPLKILYDNLPLSMCRREIAPVKPPSEDCPPFFAWFFF